MTRKWMRLSALGAIALALVITGCENTSESALIGPGESSEVRIVERLKSGYTVARETDPSVGVVWAEIDKRGGSLNIGNHVLTVPAGAVKGPTVFRMVKDPGEIEVSLTATRGNVENNVGERGFDLPVTLSLSYASAASVPADASQMMLVQVKNNGTLVAQPTAVDSSTQLVVGTLEHFSRYAIAIPD